jgi:hypothetical protein
MVPQPIRLEITRQSAADKRSSAYKLHLRILLVADDLRCRTGPPFGILPQAQLSALAWTCLR